jgi:uncharacterized membrane protein HdeD (DUF308 family)
MDKGRNWISYLISGIVTVGFGWLILARPVGTILTLTVILGLYLLILGVFDVVMVLFQHEDGNALWKVLAGVLSIMVGLFVLNNATFSAVITPIALMYIVAISYIINGVVRMVAGKPVAYKNKSPNLVWTWGGFIYGLLLLIIGFYLLLAPTLYALALMVAVVGWLAIISGVFSIVYSFIDRAESTKA